VTGKRHYEVLDGLRGSAALMVVFYHVSGLAVNWDGAKVLLHHATLAVDFFFMLSGFVLGYAYDDRWPTLTTAQFVRLRLVRLHPLLVLGTLLGFASYVLDPFAAGRQDASAGALAAALALGLLVLPAPMLPGRWDDTHPLNGPSWSLLQEYVGSLAYALVLRRLTARALGVVAAVSGTVLVACAVARGGLDAGWGWDNLWMAPIRLCFPFVTGLWLHRVHRALPRWRTGHLALSAVLVALFATPTLPAEGGVAWNGVYEAACVVAAFPLMVLAGAHSAIGPRSLALCSACGRISYPLYITHFPFLYVWGSYVTGRHPPLSSAIPIAAAILPLLILFAWAAHRGWDVPIRWRLSGRRHIEN
jgi:peptidoglycan/LPS O-acetylase OafA/YrhL